MVAVLDTASTFTQGLLTAVPGYVVPLLGDILRMPGLPKSPQAVRMDYRDGAVTGLR